MWARSKTIGIVSLAAAVLSLISAKAFAFGFGEVGVGTQVLVVDGDQGSQRGMGFDLRTRFLWVLGVDFTATSLESNEEVWMPSTYRLNILLHPWTGEHFDLYLSPGVASDAFGDLFDFTGETTWFRLGGGAEVRFYGFALGFEMHWTMPGERRIRKYVDEHSEELWEEYLMAMGSSTDLPTGVPPEDIPTILSELPTSQLLEIFPLDRFEFTIGARYYF